MSHLVPKSVPLSIGREGHLFLNLALLLPLQHVVRCVHKHTRADHDEEDVQIERELANLYISAQDRMYHLHSEAFKPAVSQSSGKGKSFLFSALTSQKKIRIMRHGVCFKSHRA